MNIRDEVVNIKFHKDQISKCQNSIVASESFLQKQKQIIYKEWSDRFTQDWSFAINFFEDHIELSTFEYYLYGSYDVDGFLDEDGNLCAEEGYQYLVAPEDDIYDRDKEIPPTAVFGVPVISRDNLELFRQDIGAKLGHPVVIEIEPLKNEDY
jgi:hypothetical protein